MAVRVHVCSTNAEAYQVEQYWKGLGFTLVDVGGLPANFQYFEGVDPAAPLHEHGSRFVVVMSNDI